MMNFADGTSRIPTSSVRLPITPNPSGVTNLAPPPGETPYATQEFVYELFSKIKDSSIFPATDRTLGGVIVGSGLTVDASGRIDVAFPSHADYLTKTDASSTYAKLSVLTDYLTKTDASSTYAKLSALTDYLTKSEASSTYATSATLAGTYATKTELEKRVPFVVDRSGTYTAALVGTFAKDHDKTETGKRSLSVGYLNSVTGDDSIVVGKTNELLGTSSVCFGESNYAETQACVIGVGSTARKTCMALGYHVNAGGGDGSYSWAMALGRYAIAERSGSFVWNGQVLDTLYSGGSRLGATFSVNPVGGIEGFYIGDKNLKTILSEEAPVPDLSGYVKKTGSGGVYLGLQYSEDMENPPLFLEIEGALKMGQPSTAGDEALLEMQAGGRPGGFKVRVTPSYDETAGEEVSSTTMSIDDIPDVAGELRKISAKRDRTDNVAVTPIYSSKWNVSYDIHSDSEELKAKLELWFRNTPTSISGSDSEGWNWNNLPVIEGYYEEDRSEIEGAYTYISYVSNTDLYGFSIIGRRPMVVTPGEPYVTPTGVKNIAIPKYEFIDATIADGVLTVAPYTNAKVKSDGTAFTVAVAEGDGKTRDCVLRVECGDTVPKIKWGNNFHPRTDSETDFACEARKRNVYWISEYAPNEFCVAGWQETDGGTSGGAS